jgi:uncharacterized protein (TIGR02266 family)
VAASVVIKAAGGGWECAGMASDQARRPRSEQHVEILLKVMYREPKELLSDYLTSLGEGGIFINTRFPFEVGERLSFSISFPGLLQPHDFDGVVRWRRPVGPRTTEDQAGLGVEFVFESEEKRLELQELLASLQEPVQVEKPARPTPFRVLLVEDNDLIQDLFAYAVRCFHYEHIGAGALEILRASDGLEAFRILEKTPVDLAIIDHFLPAMTGSNLIRRIREKAEHRDLPILVLSVGDEQIKREALESGADLFLHKPVLNKQLVHTLAKLLMRGP